MHLILVSFIALILTAGSQLTFEAPTNLSTPIAAANCTRNTQLYEHFAETEQRICPSPKMRLRTFNQIPLIETELTNNAPRGDGQEYTVEFIDQCSIGFEHFGGCDQNTDESRCIDGSSPYIRIVRFRGGERDGQVYSQNRICPGEEAPLGSDPDGIFIEEIRISPAEFRRFPILPSLLNSDPEQFSLKNGHTHLWAHAETQTFDTVIAGTSVEIRAIPTQWLWNYGDGTTRNLNHPGEPAPNHTLHHETPTSHSYTETGIFQVNLTTLYRGEFRIVGEGWQAIPGQAAVPSNAVPIDVWRTEKELVAPGGQ